MIIRNDPVYSNFSWSPTRSKFLHIIFGIKFLDSFRTSSMNAKRFELNFVENSFLNLCDTVARLIFWFIVILTVAIFLAPAFEVCSCQWTRMFFVPQWLAGWYLWWTLRLTRRASTSRCCISTTPKSGRTMSRWLGWFADSVLRRSRLWIARKRSCLSSLARYRWIFRWSWPRPTCGR